MKGQGFLFVLVIEKSSNLLKAFVLSPDLKDLNSDQQDAMGELILKRAEDYEATHPASSYDVIIGKSADDSIADGFVPDVTGHTETAIPVSFLWPYDFCDGVFQVIKLFRAFLPRARKGVFKYFFNFARARGHNGDSVCKFYGFFYNVRNQYNSQIMVFPKR